MIFIGIDPGKTGAARRGLIFCGIFPKRDGVAEEGSPCLRCALGTPKVVKQFGHFIEVVSIACDKLVDRDGMPVGEKKFYRPIAANHDNARAAMID